MPDITMCRGTGCPLRESCYRAQATPNPYRQSWFAKPPYDHKRGECERYAVVYDKPKKTSPDAGK